MRVATVYEIHLESPKIRRHPQTPPRKNPGTPSTCYGTGSCNVISGYDQECHYYARVAEIALQRRHLVKARTLSLSLSLSRLCSLVQ